MEQKKGLLEGLAKTLNAGGSALVAAYDAGSGFFSSVFKSAKGAATELPSAVKGGISKMLPGDRSRLESKIREYEKKIEGLYCEIGKESSKYAEMEKAMEGEMVKNLLSVVKDYEDEIAKITDQIASIKEEEDTIHKDEKERKIEPAKRKKESGIDEQAFETLKTAIRNAVDTGVFETASEREVFERVADYLLSDDLGLRVLSVSALGKMGNEAAAPILFEAVKLGDPYLMAEAVNSLISIGDPTAVALFKENIANPDFWVKQRCLTGLYELAYEESIDLIINALKDGHPDIRITAATFLGWRGATEAVPALMEAMDDKDARVKKAVIASLSNIRDAAAVSPLISAISDRDKEVRRAAFNAFKTITGIDFEFDADCSGDELSKSIGYLKGWWDAKSQGCAGT